jgi:transglutaminase-like putative cysteine protease
VTESTLLRSSTVVAAGAAVLSLGMQGQLRPIVAFGALVLLLVAGAAPLLLPSGRAAVLRRRAAKALVLSGCLIGALWLLATRARSGIGETTGLVHQVGTTLSVSLAVVLAAQLACADSRRELRVVLVASLMCVLVALGTSEGGGAQDLLSGLGFLLVVGWGAALLSMWLLQRAKQRDGVAFVHLGRVLGDGRHLGALVIGSTLIGLAALLLLPHPAGWHPPGLDGQGSGPGSPLQKSGNGDYQAAPRSPENYFRGAMDLNSRGKLSSTRLVSVPADSPGLWAASVLYAYDGTFWGPQQFPVNRTFQVPKDSAGDYDLRPGAAPGAAPGVAARSDVVRTLVRGAFLPVIAPGQAVAMQFDGRVVRPLGSTAEPIAPAVQRPSYVVRSNQDVADAVTKEDTALPSSLPKRVRDLARRITRSAGPTEDKVAAIQAYLHAHEVYRLDSPAPGLGKDAVDDFLFVSHEGFCEHFASAEAVLLRSIGVPARLVTGFTNGKDEGTRRVFRGTDAHAWVEVNVGGQHWVFTDPTAGATVAPPHRSRLHRAASVVAAHWQLGAGSAALLAGIVVLAVSRVRRVLVRRARRQELASPPRDQVLAAFARFENALQRLRFGRPPDSSIQELMASLLTHWPGGLPDPERMRAAFVVVERLLYDVVPVPEPAVRTTISTLDEFTHMADALGLAALSS